MTFAEELRRIRNSRVPSVSQETLAVEAAALDRAALPEDRAKFSQTRVSEWERGPMLPDLRQLTLMIRVLRCNADDDAALRLAWEREQLRGLPIVPVPPDVRRANAVDARGLDVVEEVDFTDRKFTLPDPSSPDPDTSAA